MRPEESNEMDQLRLKVRDLELALGQNNDNLAVTFRLTPVLNNLCGLLLALPVVTPEMIRQRLEIAPDAKVAIHRLRKHLEPWKIEIESRRNVGYWLEEVTKARIRALLAGGLADTPAGNAITGYGGDDVPLDDELDDGIAEAA
jgi:hypothetical protein